MKQKFTILFDLDGTLVDTAPDLMLAHNHVMRKFGYPTKSTEDIRNLVGKGAGALIGRSIWGQAKKEFSKVLDAKIKDEMVKEFVNVYGKNIVNESTLVTGVKDFLIWCKEQNISMAVCTNKQEHLSNDLLKKIGIYDFFEYVAGSDTFDYCKPDPRHLTNVVEILDGDVKKTINYRCHCFQLHLYHRYHHIHQRRRHHHHRYFYDNDRHFHHSHHPTMSLHYRL